MNTINKSDLKNYLMIVDDLLRDNLKKLESEIEILADIDKLYSDLLKVASEISPPVASALLINSHVCERAAIQLVLSGQIVPTFMSLRGLIESSLYANAIVADPKNGEIWLARHKDSKSKNECKEAFSVAKMFRVLEKAHNKTFANNLRDAYDSTIDFGAHPNCKSIIQSTQITDLSDGRKELKYIYLHGNESFALKQALVACAEISLLTFHVNLRCFKRKSIIDESTLKATELQTKTSNFIEQLGLKKADEKIN